MPASTARKRLSWPDPRRMSSPSGSTPNFLASRFAPPAAAARRRSQHAPRSPGCRTPPSTAPVLRDQTPPLQMMSVCGSNRLTTFSLAGTVSPSNTRRSVWSTTRLSRSRQAPTSVHQLSAHGSVTQHTSASAAAVGARRSCAPQAQQPLVGGRPPLLAARRANLLLAPLGSGSSCTDTCGRRSRASRSSTTGGCRKDIRLGHQYAPA